MSDKKSETIKLFNPISRGETKVKSILLRKPLGGDLRGGLNMQGVMQSDVDTIIKIVPRISEPKLTENEVADLEADDFAQVAGAVIGFFLSPDQKRMIQNQAG